MNINAVTKTLAVSLSVLTGLIFISCGGSDSPQADALKVTTEDGRELVGQVLDGSTIVDVSLGTRLPFYQPDRIVVQSGETVQFRVESRSARHSFTIDELSIDMTIPQPMLKQVLISEAVSLPYSGEYRVYCKLHDERGMETVLVVEE
ncbi:MAG: cupredoxin domain-containing protein [Chloroflexota bacterium]|nr:cupredoxin domain-containing protein [Chloroflexota bacterium]